MIATILTSLCLGDEGSDFDRAIERAVVIYGGNSLVCIQWLIELHSLLINQGLKRKFLMLFTFLYLWFNI